MGRDSAAEETYDLVILGSGTTAFAAAIRAAELGKTAVMTESRVLGGTCVNRGCLPSKNLIEAARVYWEATRPRFPGLLSRGMDIDFPALIRQKDEIIDDFRDKKYQSVVADAGRIAVHTGQAGFAPDGTVEVDGRKLRGHHYLIATGSRPIIPAIAGLDQVPYLTSDLLAADEAVELWELPRSLLIIGGGYIALELGQLFQRLGSAVTVLERSPRILPAYEPEVSVALTEILRAEGVNIVTNLTVGRVERVGSRIAAIGETAGTQARYEADRLLVATGRQPNTDAIGLEHVGVKADEHGFILVDEYLRTNVPNIWAAGDVIGPHTGSQLATPVGAHDGVIAAVNALNGERHRVDHTVIPRTIFTDPQVATVGLTDEEANRRGHRCNCGTVPMRVVPRAGAIRDTRGLIKMVLDWDTKQVLGVSIVGRDAGEVIHEAAMALRFRATVYDFIDMIHVYPTMAEALKIAALSCFKDVEKLSESIPKFVEIREGAGMITPLSPPSPWLAVGLAGVSVAPDTRASDAV
ncbi:MAG: mercury(II) reductase, partial [Armatimonadota bacterium]|nr:mercury(II) reductase [Armatimonadota bacterium]MDR7502857.1 mercury(II) reductase [Armatimonadota bacterium]